MSTPAELRAQARLYRDAAANEPTPVLKHYLAKHALALAQLAERIERDQAPARKCGGM